MMYIGHDCSGYFVTPLFSDAFSNNIICHAMSHNIVTSFQPLARTLSDFGVAVHDVVILLLRDYQFFV